MQSERTVAYSEASPAQELRDTVDDWTSAADLYDFDTAAPMQPLTDGDQARVRAWMRVVWGDATDIGCAMRVPNAATDALTSFVIRCLVQPNNGIDAETTRTFNIFAERDDPRDCEEQASDTPSPDAAGGDGSPYTAPPSDDGVLSPWMSLGLKMEAVWPRVAPSSADVWAAKMGATLRKALEQAAPADVTPELAVYVALVCPLAENGEKLAVYQVCTLYDTTHPSYSSSLLPHKPTITPPPQQGGSACTRMFRNGTAAGSVTTPLETRDADNVGASFLTALPGSDTNDTSGNATHDDGTTTRAAAALSESRQEFDDIAADAATTGVYVEVIIEDTTEERISASVLLLKNALLAASAEGPPLYDLCNIEAGLLVISPLLFNTGEIVMAVQAGDYYAAWQQDLSEALNEPDFVPHPSPDGVGDVRKSTTGGLNEGHWVGVAAGCAALCVLVGLAAVLGVSRAPKDDCVTVKDFYRSMPGGDPERGDGAGGGCGYSPPSCVLADQVSASSSVEMADLLSTKNSLKNLTFSNVQPCGCI